MKNKEERKIDNHHRKNEQTYNENAEKEPRQKIQNKQNAPKK